MLLLLSVGNSSAADVTFTGIVVNTCTLVATPGVLALSSDGQKLTSDTIGGLPAEVAIVSLGPNTVTVGTPTLTGFPAGYDPTGQVLRVGYQGLNLLAAVIQDLTGIDTSFIIGALPLTVLQVHNEIENPAGFPQGTYQSRTVVTCS